MHGHFSGGLGRSGAILGVILVACTLASAEEGPPRERERFTPGGVFVKFERHIGPDSPEWIAAEHITMGREYYRYRSIPSMMTLAVPLGTEDDAVFWLRQIPGVERVGRHALGNLASCPPNPAPVEDDFFYPQQWWLVNCGQTINSIAGTVEADINIKNAWNIQTDGSGVVIAIVDSGVYYHHPDFWGNMWENPGEIGPDQFNQDKRTNGIDDDSNGWIDDVHGINTYGDDDCSTQDQPAEGDPNPGEDQGLHGTRIAWQIGASANTGYAGSSSLPFGGVGVAHTVSMMAVRESHTFPCGPQPVSGFIQGLDYALSMGANIINCSWYFTENDPALEELCAVSEGSGVILIVAAGNQGYNLDDPSTNPPPLLYPQVYDFDHILVVAAINQLGCLGSFSNRGSISVDLAAPGTNIIAPPFWIEEPNAPYHPDFPYPDVVGTPFEFDTGTSFAAPLVSGVAALLWTKEPTLSYAQVISRILNTGDRRCDLQSVTVSGRRLNAYRVLANDPDTTQCDSCP